MARIETVAADTPFAQRVLDGFGYPLRGAALATCVSLALIHYVGLLPLFIGFIATLLVWTATWRYAVECLLHTARGFADPPDVGVDEAGAAGWGLTAIHMLAIALYVNGVLFFPHLLWPMLLLFALALPAIDMALAFDGNLLLALDPRHLWRIVRGFGLAYLIPVAINLLLVTLILLASLATAHLPRVLALPLFGFAYSYLIVLAFHLMGAMIHRRHEPFGVELKAEAMRAAYGQDADTTLLDEAQRLAAEDPMAALRLLAARLRERTAPATLHQAYRRMLQQQGLHDDLLVHGQIWIAALLAQGEARRALAVLQECTDLDDTFMPDDPDNAAMLAEQAQRLGMPRVAVRLCRGYLRLWPRSPSAPALGLLAARLLGDALGQQEEAIALLGKLAAEWPDHPIQADIARLQRQFAERP